ncbi:MAG: hypothetical protein LBM00_07785 [Deltaproteobacteria bacterium]|jgi:hypothetical protein|nr:hypothetical protein [Deltaproteobacteria bacterium]
MNLTLLSEGTRIVTINLKRGIQMSREKVFSYLLLCLLLLCWSSIATAEVGYINILNGIEPPKAFVVERGGSVVTPKSIYTDLEEGDVVKPSDEALLLFTPLDTSCESVEIRGEFTATACPPPSTSLKDAAYDFVADEFLSAPAETVGVFATRGAGDKRVHSLPLLALRLYVESDELAESLKKTPFVALTDNKAEAEALIIGRKTVQVLSPGESAGPSFTLPGEAAALRRTLLSRIHYKTMAGLVSAGSRPAVGWSITIYTPAENGPLDYDGRKWVPVGTILEAGSENTPIAVDDPCLLTFSLINHSLVPYYVYLFNYTDEGQIVSVLPPEEVPLMPNVAAAGAELPMGRIFLELGARQENVRLILSENPLDLRRFQQENLSGQAAATVRTIRMRPAPADSWFTATQTFTLK